MNNPAVKTFVSATIVLLIMLILTGLLTFFIPTGQFDMQTQTYTLSESRGIGILTWIGAPILVLASSSGPLVIAIILFLLIIGGAIHTLKEVGLLEGIILSISRRFESSPVMLLGILTFVFMSFGAFIGAFEEIVPLVPLVIMLSKKMGWDDLTGLGVSLLATGLGFAAALTNPFTIGIAQQLAELPMFSGILLRIPVFLSVYLLLFLFLRNRVLKLKPVNEGLLDTSEMRDNAIESQSSSPLSKKAYSFFTGIMIILLITVLLTPFVEVLRSLTLPIIGLLFLIAAIGVGLIGGKSPKWVCHRLLEGARDMSPAILLILLATGIKHIMIEGHILDFILWKISMNIGGMSPLVAVFASFLLVMCLNFFIGSGSAKAFVLMPILMPIMDLLGIGRQLGILAFQFGDGFSNVLYPTNAVLLICLGLSGVSYGRWIRFIIPLQFALMGLSLLWLSIGYFIGYGI